MTWQPEKNVIDLTQIADNLVGYFEEQQTDALEWAGISSQFEKFYTNASGRLQTIFPSLMILTQASETDLAGDLLESGLQLTLEGTVSGPNADDLVADTKKYARAVESMLANIPSDTLTANSSPRITAWLFEIETQFDILRGQQSPSAFLQIFQIRALYKLASSGY